MPRSHLTARGALVAVLGLVALSACAYQPPPEAPMPAAPPAPAPAPTPPPARGEFQPGVPMAAAVARVLGGAVAAEQKTNLGFDWGVTFMGALLQPKSFINWRMQLEAGMRYAFLGGGDNNAVDVDLAVVDAEGRILARDQLADAKPVVAFTPSQTGVYIVRMTLTQAPRPSFCALAILRQGGFTVPVKNLTTSLQKIMAAGRLASQRASVRFHEEPNQWALFGAVLRPGDTTTVSGLKPRGAAARLRDRRRRQRQGPRHGAARRERERGEEGRQARLGRRRRGPDRDASYQLAITNVDSTGPALVTAVILDVM